MDRVYNFSAGPSNLPLPVLEKAKAELLNHEGCGMSVMEISHRSVIFDNIIQGAEATLRELMHIPSNYKVLFLQGGASTQFSMIPMNLMKNNKKADYIVTGVWAKNAAVEAERYGDVNVVATSKDKNFSYIPKLSAADFNKDAAYLHYTHNNTIYGTRFNYLPDTSAPRVIDVSSSILSEEMDVNNFALMYAGCQKNMGIAGVTLVIIRDDMIEESEKFVPTMMSYKVHSDKVSIYNTPPVFSIYLSKLVLEWLRDLGGVSVIEKINKEKAALIYDFLDESKIFNGSAAKEDRSLMNIPFTTGNDELNAKFIKEAGQNGLVNLKGHRSTGGMRVSVYNAMPIESVKVLVDFLKKFEMENK